MNRKILIFQRRMTKYRVPMFEALRRRLEQEQISLQVVYGRLTSAEQLREDEENLSWGIEITSHYFNLWNSNLVWHPTSDHGLEYPFSRNHLSGIGTKQSYGCQ